MRKHHISVIFFCLTWLSANAKPDGKELFTTNCSACHQLDQMVVGPSLVEMRLLYNGRPDDFVKWSIAPQSKRVGVIEMPSMAHVGDEGLRAIYRHIMEVSEGVREKTGAKKGDPFAKSPMYDRFPQVQRMFMPNAGPAAIAVAIDENVSICWDAGECRLRYAWKGGFIDGWPYWQSNGSSLATIEGEVKYTEASPPLQFGGEMKFLGYGLKDGLPIFRYRIGERTISETYATKDGGSGFERSFTISPAPDAALKLKLPSGEGALIVSDKGKWNGEALTLAPAEAASFTLTYSLK